MEGQMEEGRVYHSALAGGTGKINWKDTTR